MSKKGDQSDSSAERVRLDKWLCAARFFKTRNLAREAIEGGKVRYEGQRPKAGKFVIQGARVEVHKGSTTFEVIIDRLSDKRGSATQAEMLYTETEASKEKREENAWRRRMMVAAEHPPARRPNKKQRRELQRVKNQMSH
ncbi:S4 domain-containing protein [Salicola sp. Rm-C-2C1-2]|uniref:RNA-binding S4 domain-containing protein n=1 Tax=Salicola sp. Rm-C-2C1-2 TaxID=3141321 RepID=UPI0032E502B3